MTEEGGNTKAQVPAGATRTNLVQRIVNWVVNRSGDLAAAIIIPMMLLTTADVVGRYAFNSPVQGTFDFTKQMMAFIVFLAVAYVQSARGHVKVDMATTWLPPRTQQMMDIGCYVVGLAILALITWQGAIVSWQSYLEGEHSMGILKVPTWPGRMAFTFGMALMCVQLISDIVSDSTKLASGRK